MRGSPGQTSVPDTRVTGGAGSQRRRERPATQRDRQKRATREALRSAALRLFAEHGFRETTVDDIAGAVGVSKRTFFLHFPSKEDVLLGHVAEQLALLRAELDRAPEGLSPMERAGYAVAALAEQMQRRDDLLLQLDLLHRAPQLLAANLEQFTAFEDEIAAAVHRWLGGRRAGHRATRAEDEFAQLIGTVMMGGLRSALTLWRRRGGRGDLSTLVRGHVALLRTGLRAP